MKNPFEVDQEQIRLLKLIKNTGLEVDRYLKRGLYKDCLREVNNVLVEILTKDFVTTVDTGKALEEVTNKGVNLSVEELREGLKQSADIFHSVKSSLDHDEMLKVVKEVLRVESYITFINVDKESIEEEE